MDLVTGDGSGIEFAFAERKAEDGSTLIVGFGLMNAANHPGDPEWVRAQAARLFPNARIVSHDWHDWVDDPFARGTWVAALVGHEDGLDSATWQRQGRIAFASSDYARDQAGWFEGAVIAGEEILYRAAAFGVSGSDELAEFGPVGLDGHGEITAVEEAVV